MLSDLRSRWQRDDGPKLAAEVVRRVVRGQRLDAMGLGEHQGRVDLRGLAVPSEVPRQRGIFGKWAVSAISGTEIRSGRLEGLDLSFADWPGIRILGGQIVNCVFHRAKLRDLRLWAVDVNDSSFALADLRGAVLGGWLGGRGNTYLRTSFRSSDLRDLATPTAVFEDCDFSLANVKACEFDSDFIRCQFAGLLEGVIFHANGVQAGKRYPNRFLDVDFRQAELRMVSFRGFDLDRVDLPDSPTHRVIERYRCTLTNLIGELHRTARHPRARAGFEYDLKFAGPNQQRGVVNTLDLIDDSDDQSADDLLRLIGEAEARCLGKGEQPGLRPSS